MSSEFDYVVVGSGAGGGPLACRLAQDPARYKVALLEAGTDPAIRPDGSENPNYAVPVLHGRATEDPHLSWDFFVRHYSADERQSKDSKLYPPAGATDKDVRRKGIWYPRAGTLGGCTAHNAMITLYPHNEDWEHLRTLTGDPSWAAGNMRRYFEKLENCRYAPSTPNTGRHGFGNWLSTSLLDVKVLAEALRDNSIQAIAVAAVKTGVSQALAELRVADHDARIRAFIERARVFLEVLQSAAERLPEAKRAQVARMVSSLARIGEDEITGLKAQLAIFSTAIHAAGGARVPRGIAGQGIDNLLDRFIDKILENVLGGMSLNDLVELLVRFIDPNDWRVVQAGLQGIFAIPLATDGVRRSSPRELIRDTQNNCPYRLEVMTNVLVTRVIFEGTRAVGVRYITGPHPYCASPLNQDRLAPSLPPLPQEQEIRVRHEVILAGGAFNTPQLLMLSGVGPEDELKKWGIAPVGGRFWPGVGKNLQDRYEVAVISEMKKDFEILKTCRFDTPAGSGDDDPCFVAWRDEQAGVYTTNGALFSIIRRSSQAEHLVPPADPNAVPPPDLFIFGLLGFFKGYYPYYSQAIEQKRNILTWAILKGHTRNTRGEVRLRSRDPRDPPLINFKYFDDDHAVDDSGAAKDAEALIEGIEFVKEMLDRTGQAVKVTAWPNVPLDDLDDSARRRALREFIINETWGHHACGTCKIGRDPRGAEAAVLDGDFRVLGLDGLRVVDASVFPRIPGFFIVTPVYMISEKAAEVILRDAIRR